MKARLKVEAGWKLGGGQVEAGWRLGGSWAEGQVEVRQRPC